MVDRGFDGAITVLEESRQPCARQFSTARCCWAAACCSTAETLVAGNGGSAADAQHLASELVGQFKEADRPGLPVIALIADSAILTAWSTTAATRGLRAAGRGAGPRRRRVVVVSTSGRSRDLVQACEAATAGHALPGPTRGAKAATCARPPTSRSSSRRTTRSTLRTHILIIHPRCQAREVAGAGGTATNRHIRQLRPRRVRSGTTQRAASGSHARRPRQEAGPLEGRYGDSSTAWPGGPGYRRRGGLGSAICRTLATTGAVVVVADMRMDPADEVAAAVRQDDGAALAMHLDVNAEGRIEEVVRPRSSDAAASTF